MTKGEGVGKSESKKGRVTRDGIYKRPLSGDQNVIVQNAGLSHLEFIEM